MSVKEAPQNSREIGSSQRSLNQVRSNNVIHCRLTEDGLRLSNGKGEGAGTWADDNLSSEEYQYPPSFGTLSKARTTWSLNDIDEYEQRQEFKRLYRLQHNRGGHYSVAQREYDKGFKIRQKRSDRHDRSDAILQGHEVQDASRRYALRKVMQENLRGFNSHYAGADGACLGFALLHQYDTPSAAKKSYVADKARETGFEFDIDALIDYTFSKYGAQNHE